MEFVPASTLPLEHSCRYQQVYFPRDQASWTWRGASPATLHTSGDTHGLGRAGLRVTPICICFLGRCVLLFCFNFLFTQPLLPFPTLANVPVFCLEIPLGPSILNPQTSKANILGWHRSEADMRRAPSKGPQAVRGPRLTPRPACGSGRDTRLATDRPAHHNHAEVCMNPAEQL